MESKDGFILREESLSPRSSNGGHRHSRSMDEVRSRGGGMLFRPVCESSPAGVEPPLLEVL